jgi:hypothetical protein
MADDTPTKGSGIPGHPVEVKNSPVPFVVREADDRDAAAAQKLKDDVDQRIERLKLRREKS